MTNSPEPPSNFGPSSGSASTEPSWRWRLEDAAGKEVAVDGFPATQAFPSQSDAETWVGETWEDLLEGGAEAVTLFEGDREVYGPMGLRPAG